MTNRLHLITTTLTIFTFFFVSYSTSSGGIKFPWSKKEKENVRKGELPGILEKISGRIAVLQGGTDTWIGVARDLQVFKGDQIRTLEGSRTKIKLPDNHELHIGENSLVTLVEIIKDDKENRHITLTKLARGSVWAKVSEPTSFMEKLRGKDYLMEFQFKISALNVSAFPLGTAFTMMYLDKETVLISSCKGDLEINGTGGNLLIPRKYYSTVSGSNPSRPIQPTEYIEERKDDPKYKFCFTCHNGNFKSRVLNKGFE